MIQFRENWLQTEYESKESLRFLHIFGYMLEPNREIWQCFFFLNVEMWQLETKNTHTHIFRHLEISFSKI
jgi:hypothetical protein